MLLTTTTNQCGYFAYLCKNLPNCKVIFLIGAALICVDMQNKIILNILIRFGGKQFMGMQV